MDRTLRIINLVFFILMILVNALGEYMPLGVGSTGEISAKYPNLFTPAPITFSIWGLIYLMVAIFIFYQMGWGASNAYTTELVSTISFWFVVSCIMNIGWMISWHYDMIIFSLVYMIGLLLTLIIITSRFQQLSDPPMLAKVSGIGFYIYLGWICAATIANVSVLLVKANWNRFGLSEQTWTMIVIIVGTALGILFIATKRNYFSAIAIIWAYCGILIKHISQSGYSGKYPLIIAVTIVGIVLILTTGVVKMIQK